MDKASVSAIHAQVKQGLVMRNFNFGIVDEVDSILIDEARTPIIISGSAGTKSFLSVRFGFGTSYPAMLLVSSKVSQYGHRNDSL